LRWPSRTLGAYFTYLFAALFCSLRCESRASIGQTGCSFTEYSFTECSFTDMQLHRYAASRMPTSGGVAHIDFISVVTIRLPKVLYLLTIDRQER
jgi:hypothetical protein